MLLPNDPTSCASLESTKEVTTDSSDQGPAPGFGHGIYLEMKATRRTLTTEQ